MQIKDHIFREYDIRGTVGSELTDEFAYILGRAYARLLSSNNHSDIVIGHDCRISSPGFARELARGLSDEGINVCLTGMGPTPQLYYSIFARFAGGGIQVTGSHNPPDMNGFKMCLGIQTLSGAQIQDIKKLVYEVKDTPLSNAKKGAIVEHPMQQAYIQEIVSKCKPYVGSRPLKVVVDAGNGVGGLAGPAVLRELGVDVIELFCDPDGTFPNHHPDPTELKNVQDLIRAVKENGADFGIGWDGDADRIGVVDEQGQMIFGDMLLLIYGRAILEEVPDATVIGDVKCSSLLFDDLQKRGANAVMWKTGHSLIKSKLRELDAELAGEMSGHIFFKHRYYGFDDAIYASARLVEIMSKIEGPLSGLLNDLPKLVSTPEIRVDCPEEIKFKLVAAAQKAFPEYQVNTLDGVRISFDGGWGLVRASNTQPVLVMRFEASDPGKLEEIKSLVTGRIEKLKLELGA
ncbi:MAG: phosphomannomutase/phosphoglucomutase [Deltaproteobacteria bacterium]|nr:phosphomannomutase/phosphoglucomutase [Deltaproteobacteria bacterium]